MYYSCLTCGRKGDGWQFSGNSGLDEISCPQCGSIDTQEIDNPKKLCVNCENHNKDPELCIECTELSKKILNQIDKPFFNGIVLKVKKEKIPIEKEILKTKKDPGSVKTSKSKSMLDPVKKKSVTIDKGKRIEEETQLELF